MSAQARLLLIQIVTHHVLYENDNPAFRIFTWNLKFKVHASMDLERFLAMDDPLTHVHCASIIENDIDSVACGCSQLGRRKTHLCCDFNLVLQIYIVITFLYLNLTYWYCLFIMVCAITLYLSECTRPNKKSSFSGTVHKKKFHSRCCNVRDVNLTSVESFWEKFSPIWENVNDILPVL